MDVGTGLVTEEEAPGFGARVESRNRRPALAVAAAVRVRERTAEGTVDGRRVAPEHRVLLLVARDLRAQVLQRVPRIAVRCDEKKQSRLRQ